MNLKPNYDECRLKETGQSVVAGFVVEMVDNDDRRLNKNGVVYGPKKGPLYCYVRWLSKCDQCGRVGSHMQIRRRWECADHKRGDPSPDLCWSCYNKERVYWNRAYETKQTKLLINRTIRELRNERREKDKDNRRSAEVSD